jgi:hypothetical protein
MHNHPDCTGGQGRIADSKSPQHLPNPLLISSRSHGTQKPDFSVILILRTEFLRTTGIELAGQKAFLSFRRQVHANRRGKEPS